MATPWLLDPNFRRTVLVILEDDNEGTLAVILNRPSEVEPDGQLPHREAAAEPTRLFVGGPVAMEGGYVVGEAAGHVDVGVDVGADRRFGILGADSADVSRVRYYVGHAGWAPGQLDGELDEGAWWLVAGTVDDWCSAEPEALWQTVVSRQRPKIAMYAGFPVDPRHN